MNTQAERRDPDAISRGEAPPRGANLRPGGRVRMIAKKPIVMWVAFVFVHVFLGAIAFTLHKGFGDVYNVYAPWSQDALRGWVVGIDEPWVYPIAAIVPIVVPGFFGVQNYAVAWLVLVTLVDACAFALLLRRRQRRRLIAAWWWLGFLLLLGPVALGRLDAISAALAIIGLLWLSTRERTAIIVLTVATWIKVWPAALLAAAIVALRRRARIVLVAVLSSIAILVVPLAFGAGWNVLSFVTKQTGRGIQIEAPVALPWMWQAVFGVRGAHVYFDARLITFQIAGHGTHIGEALMTPFLAAAVIGLLLIGIRAARHGSTYTHILPELALALVTAFIAFNKVGSPQYITWFVAPTVYGLVVRGRQFRVPSVFVLITAALTQAFYPYLYGGLTHPNAVMVTILTLRNLMYFVILGWTVTKLWGAGRPRPVHLSS